MKVQIKKIFLFFSICMFLFSVANTPHTSKMKEESLQNDFHITKRKTNGYNIEDFGEPNDNIGIASSLTEDDYYLQNVYTRSISAQIDNSLGSSDHDFYYLPLFTESKVTLYINEEENQNYPYEMYIFHYIYNNNGLEKDKACKSLEEIPNNDSENQKQKEFVSILNPGTYIFVIKSDSTVKSRITIDYDIFLKVEKTQRNTNEVSVGELRYCKGAFGAVWKSDYIPVLSNYFFMPNQSLTYYQENTAGIEYRDYALEKLMKVSNGASIHMATYYIWNPDILDILNRVFNSIWNVVSQSFKNAQQLRVEFELIKDNTENVLTIEGNIVDAVGLVVSISPITIALLELATFFTENMIMSFLERMIPTQTYLSYQYFNWLRDYIVSTNHTDPDCDILEIPFYYRLTTKQDSALTRKKYQIDFSATFDETQDELNKYTDADTIPVELDDDFYCRGKVYGMNFDNNGDVCCDEINNIAYTPIEPTNLYEDIMEVINPLKKNEFKWYKFTANESATYAFVNNMNSSDNVETNKCTISLFSEIDYGYNETHMLLSATGGYYLTNDTDEREVGTYCRKNMKKDQTIYIKVSEKNYGKLAAGAFTISKTEHFHEYTDHYAWDSLTRHKSYCICNRFSFDFHVVSGTSSLTYAIGNTSRCALCNGPASIGIVNGYSLSKNRRFVLKEDGLLYPEESYIIDGNIILSYEDSILFKQNESNISIIKQKII